jgi:hypothetical protein
MISGSAVDFTFKKVDNPDPEPQHWPYCRDLIDFFYLSSIRISLLKNKARTSVSDPHRFYADPDPAFLLNADPDRLFWLLRLDRRR